MRLHHARAQPPPAARSDRRSSCQLRQPRRGQGRGVSARAFGGAASYAGLRAAIDDPEIDAVVVAVPPRFHLDLTLQALAAGKHVLVEKPAFPRMADYADGARGARPRPARIVLVGENDHYKPLAVTLRRLLAEGAIGDMVFAHFTTIAQRLKTADDWRNDESDGRRRRVLRGRASTGCTSPAASARGSSGRSRATGRRRPRERAATRAPRA